MFINKSKLECKTFLPMKISFQIDVPVDQCSPCLSNICTTNMWKRQELLASKPHSMAWRILQWFGKDSTPMIWKQRTKRNENSAVHIHNERNDFSLLCRRLGYICREINVNGSPEDGTGQEIENDRLEKTCTISAYSAWLLFQPSHRIPAHKTYLKPFIY